MEKEPYYQYAGNKSSCEWQAILNQSIITAEELSHHIPINISLTKNVIDQYPMRINNYYLSLIKKENDAIWKQCIPDIDEIRDDFYIEDPLSEESQSPITNLIHRYPDRVLFIVSNKCAVYCRHCMRKRKTGRPYFIVTDDTINQGIDYIKRKTEIRDVILSGGDPLLLEDDVLENILIKLRTISHVEIIRIHTRVPCTLPQRITLDLSQMLKKFHPIYINTHFNHPDEITKEASISCSMLADAGIPLGNQTVLLKNINDDPDTMKILMQNLLKIRVKPYYIHHADLIKGTAHFRTPIDKGLHIMEMLRGYISGLGVPYYMIDLPGGCGKMPLIPNSCVCKDNDTDSLVIKNFKGKISKYPLY